jgi:uncharacterized protein YycO
MKAAFYKGTKSGFSGLFEIAVRAWGKGDYSHAELVFSDGRAASSTFLDKGVRILPAGQLDVSDVSLWDVIDLPMFDEAAAIAWFEANAGKPYDVWGDAHFVIGFIPESQKDFFCSESVAAALAFPQAWRYDPNTLFCTLSRFASLMRSAA